MPAAMRSLEEPGRGAASGKQRSGLLRSPGGAWLRTYITRIRLFRRCYPLACNELEATSSLRASITLLSIVIPSGAAIVWGVR
jgi:hypothetical protein